MRQNFDVWVLRPLSREERDRAIAMASAVEESLASRDPSLLLEVVSTLIGGLMYDISGPANDTAKLTDEQIEEATIRLFGHALERVKSMAGEGIDLMIAHRDRKG